MMPTRNAITGEVLRVQIGNLKEGKADELRI